MLNLLKKHWLGDYSVARSLLLHTLFVNFILLSVQRILDPYLLFNNAQTASIILGLFVLSWTVILLWQIVGCFRASGNPAAYSGSGFDSYLVFFGSLVAVAVVLSGLFSLFYEYTDIKYPKQTAQAIKDKPYQIGILDNGVLEFSGDIHFGATRDIESILLLNPHISTLVLESEGGIIVEARGMANAVYNYSLNTHANSKCFSACTLVYISGVKRTLGADARLGFHQYAVNSEYPLTWIDTDSEHSKDQKRFKQQAISSWFVEKMYTQPHDSIWIPTYEELMRAGVLTRID